MIFSFFRIRYLVILIVIILILWTQFYNKPYKRKKQGRTQEELMNHIIALNEKKENK